MDQESRRGNRIQRRRVIQNVARFRALAAGVGACVALAGCGTEVGGETTTTTSPTASEASGNPWDLPIEQRPPLFDPCGEIPIEAVEEGVGGPVEKADRYTRIQPGELMSCGWVSDELHLTILSTWKSRSEFMADDAFVVRDPESIVDGRPGLRLVDESDTLDRSCLQLLFTSEGTIWFRVDLSGGLAEFRGQRLVEACDALDVAITPLVRFVAEGDFR